MRYRVTIRRAGAPDEVRLVDAPSHFAIYAAVEKEGGVVTAIDDTVFTPRLPAWLNVTIGTGVKRAEVMRLAKNLSAMLGAGLSVARALSVIERQSGNRHLKRVTAGLTEAVKKGASFHEALAAYPRVFPGFLVAMARSGEESGSLANSLAVVALQMERADELSRKVKGAMIYPAIVIVAIFVVAALMLVYVVPTLTRTFIELGVEVPLATRVVVALSEFLVGHLPLALLSGAALLVGGYFFIRSERGGALVVGGALRLPVIGEIVRETYTARAARTLASLLTAGVPVLSALAIVKEVVHARAFAAVIEEAQARVKKGEPLSAAFAGHPRLYPLQMSDMLAVGEETGKVADMLRQVAEFYEEDVAQKTKDLSTVIEPVLMLIIGVVVGVFAVSMIAPIYQLSEAI